MENPFFAAEDAEKVAVVGIDAAGIVAAAAAAAAAEGVLAQVAAVGAGAIEKP